MPTARGWTAIGVAVALLALWAAFGERELMTAAMFLAAAVGVGLAFVHMASSRASIDRRLFPPTAHEGDTVTVEVRLTTSRRLRNVGIEDVVHGLGMARFAAAVTVPEGLIARYEVSCRERGAYHVGPAAVTVNDPLALTERRTSAGSVDRLLVYPRVEHLHGFPAVRGRDPAMQSSHPTLVPSGGDDFFTLREYQVGDDLRKVHWPSSAKRDDLVVKQLEFPWHARALVILDVRTDRYPDAASFEHAVRGAASVITHLYRGGFSPDLWTSERAPGPHSGSRYREAMEVLATVQPIPGLDLRATLARLRRQGVGGGALLLVTGEPDDAVLAVLRMLSRSFTRTVMMTVDGAQRDGRALLESSSGLVVASFADSRWAPAWKSAMERSWATASAG
jgi:uncharacterized protein (DUF58 family)